MAKVADSDGGHGPARLSQRAGDGRALERAIAIAHVDSIRGDEVDGEASAVEITSSDRRGTRELGRDRLKWRDSGDQIGGDLVRPLAEETLHFEEVSPRGDIHIDQAITSAGRGAVALNQWLALRIDEREPCRETRHVERDRQLPSRVRRDAVVRSGERGDWRAGGYRALTTRLGPGDPPVR